MIAELQRREFLTATGALVAGGFAGLLSWAGEIPRDIRITRIIGFDVTNQRPKMVGKNSRLDVHGDRANDRMVRLFTNAGIEGIGNCRADQNDLRPLLSKPLMDFYDRRATRMTALGNGTMP